MELIEGGKINLPAKLYNPVESLKAAIDEIAKGCPILSSDKDGMYNERAENLFLKSTVRRMEIAMKAKKEYEEML